MDAFASAADCRGGAIKGDHVVIGPHRALRTEQQGQVGVAVFVFYEQRDGSGASRLGDAEAIGAQQRAARSEEHTSELQSLMRISYAVFCLTKTNETLTPTSPR